MALRTTCKYNKTMPCYLYLLPVGLFLVISATANFSIAAMHWLWYHSCMALLFIDTAKLYSWNSSCKISSDVEAFFADVCRFQEGWLSYIALHHINFKQSMACQCEAHGRWPAGVPSKIVCDGVMLSFRQSMVCTISFKQKCIPICAYWWWAYTMHTSD